MRRKSTLWVLLLVSSLPLVASAQASDADRLAARELYAQGDKLQQEGKFAEALDKFQRSYDTFNAPTTALHIAECQAALLRLVEAAETYRGIARLPLDDKSPEAFRKARDQAIAELAQVEPRIPHLTIKITPPNLPNLAVMVDGQMMKTALVGVSRPINPGVHKISAVAPGYLQAEQSIDVKERASPAMEIVLRPGGVTYTPTLTPTPNPNPTPQYPPYAQPQPQPGWSGADWRPPPRGYSRMSLLFGAHLGAMFPAGDFTNASAGLSDVLSAGFGAGADIAFRFARSFFIGINLEGGGFGSGARSATGGWTFHGAPYLGFTSNPEGFGFYGEIGGAGRVLGAPGNTFTGGEFLLGLGFHVKASMLRIMPKAQMFVGTFTNDDLGPIRNTGVHAIFTLGVTVAFDLDLDKPKQDPNP